MLTEKLSFLKKFYSILKYTKIKTFIACQI